VYYLIDPDEVVEKIPFKPIHCGSQCGSLIRIVTAKPQVFSLLPAALNIFMADDHFGDENRNEN
jgi:hypothetical protein